VTDRNQIVQLVQRLIARQRWTGPLEANQIAGGAHLCWSNAVSLLSEARLLATHSRIARSLALTVLALEELAKPPLLWALSPSDDVATWRSFWKEQFSRHSEKQKTIGQYGLFLEAIGHGVFDVQVDQAVVQGLDQLKQWSLYVDCVDGEFQAPDAMAAELPAVLDLIFAAAEERADSFAQFHATAEHSRRGYEERQLLNQSPLKPGLLWPPVLESEAAVRGLLLSLASMYSRSQPPDYYNFGDACEQLAEVLDASTLDRALTAIARLAYERTQCVTLATSAERAFLMMKLALHRLPKERRSAVVPEWKEETGV